MRVVKRDGRSVLVKYDKITVRIERLCYGLDTRFIQPEVLTKKVINGLYDGVSTRELDNLAAEQAATLITHHPQWGTLASRIVVSNLHKETSKSFYNTMKHAYENIDKKTGQKAPLISKKTLAIIQKHAAVLDEEINYERDYQYDYFGLKTLEKSYLLRSNGQIIERPQHMLMRMAVGVEGDNLQNIKDTYARVSELWGTHATPTLFNAGTPKPQMSSCFLLTMKDDSIVGIYDTLRQTAEISQSAGGIGLAISNVRAKGSYIKGTGGVSNGIVPMLRTFDMTARYVDQGGGKRKGSFAIYLEPWHADIIDFLELKKNHGKEEMRARDLFYALWIPDLFMRRVENDEEFSLFCPSEAPGLQDVWGEDFDRLYLHHERNGKARLTIKARELWQQILDSQTETGTPYMLYKDSANRKSNQKHLGTIKSSNLCTEIIEYTAPDEVAVCNLASLNLPKFVVDGVFDHQLLYTKTKGFTYSTNRVIDENYYPVEESRKSNMRHRPIGLGVQGLADAFILLRLPFESEEAQKLNAEIFETMYYAAMEASIELAEKDGPYETFKGSPLSEGIFQFDMWNVKPSSGRWDWEALRDRVKKSGARNSLLLAPMPTASTSQILGNNECFEPYTSNLYVRRTIAGEFIVPNKHLYNDLIKLGMWNEDMRQRLIRANGSVQNITELPQSFRDIYRTVWEISQKTIINMAVDRGAFICQSQSLNIHLTNPNPAKLSSMHFHAWKKGLKTGMYYLRTTAAAEAIKFTVQKEEDKIPPTPITAEEPNLFNQAADMISCSLDNPEACEACGS